MKEFKLDNERKITSGFKVPESYFDNLENEVQKKIGEKEIRVISLFTKKNWIIAAAAVFVLALSIPIVNHINTSSAIIDPVQIETYLTEQSTLSEDDIVELLDEEKIQKIKLELNVNKNELEEVLLTNSNLEDYFIN